jgi:hypothetical protein
MRNLLRKRYPLVSSRGSDKGQRKAVVKDSATSCQTIQRLIWLESVSPRGKKTRLPGKMFGKQSNEEFDLHPSARRFDISFW